MKFSLGKVLLLALAAESTIASTSLGKAGQFHALHELPAQLPMINITMAQLTINGTRLS